MTNRVWTWLATGGCLSCLAAVLVGCDKRDDEVRYVRVDQRHVCSIDCDEHYVRDSKVVVVRGHRHGSGCGHEWDGRQWVIVRTPSKVVVKGHVCTPRCAHYYDQNGKVVVLRGHRHGRDCGHVYDGQRWTVRTVVRKSP